MAVHLRQGETHRQRGSALALGQGLDTGTHLFAHAGGGKQRQTHHHRDI